MSPQFQPPMVMGRYMCPPQMYGGMGQMGGMNWGAANVCDVDDDSTHNKKMEASKKKRKTVDIDLSQESTSNISDNDLD